MRIELEYMHEDVKAFTMAELIEYLNEKGKDGWMLVSHGKADKPGYASIILVRNIV